MPTEEKRDHGVFLNTEDYLGEFRSEKREGKPSLFTGYTAKFNKLSQPMYGMREQILPGAFTRTLREGADVRGLINHDPNLVLGRTTSGTMRLKETNIGLWNEIDAPDTSYARDLAVSIERGDVNQGSFKFRVINDNWRMQDGETIRDLVDVELMDSSIVTFPAYLDTTAQMRSMVRDIGLDTERMTRILVCQSKKLPIDEKDRTFLGDCVKVLTQARDEFHAPILSASLRRLQLAERELGAL